MKIKFLFTAAILTILSFNVSAQTATKRISLPDNSEVKYTLVDNSFNGPYIITNKDNVVITRGNYTNDMRTGNWYFFNADGSVFLRYNYDLKKALAVDEKALSFANVKVLGASESEKASIPIPLMAMDQYVELLGTLVKQKIPSPIKNNIEQLNVQIIADVDESGKATYAAKYRLNNLEKIQNFDLIDQKYTINWIPASFEKRNLKSQFSFNIVLRLAEQQSNAANQKRFKWN